MDNIKVGARNNMNDKQSIQAIHDNACDLGAECQPMDFNEGITAMINGKAIKGLMDMGAEEYARQESWDIIAAAQVLGQVGQMCQSELDELVHLDQLTGIIKELCAYIMAEADEMTAAAKQDAAEDATETATPEPAEAGTQITANYNGDVLFKSTDKVPAQVIEHDSASNPNTNNLNLSYVKSLGIDLPYNKLAVKYVGKNTIAHPVFLWGDPNKADLEAEFFTKSTDFWDKALGDSPRPLTWEHGQDPRFAKFENNPVIGKTVKFYDDDVARWAESVIDTDKKYRKYIDQFIEEKRLGYSSDSAPQYVTREKQGKATWLKMWAWFGGSLTASPCEPRMKVFTPEFIKSQGIVIPDAEKWQNYTATSDYLKIKYQIGD